VGWAVLLFPFSRILSLIGGCGVVYVLERSGWIEADCECINIFVSTQNAQSGLMFGVGFGVGFWYRPHIFIGR
jgi:hypothetical protein